MNGGFFVCFGVGCFFLLFFLWWLVVFLGGMGGHMQQCVDCNIPRSVIPPASVGLVCTLIQRLTTTKHFRKKS